MSESNHEVRKYRPGGIACVPIVGHKDIGSDVTNFVNGLIVPTLTTL
jgi:hypothetical protein